MLLEEFTGKNVSAGEPLTAEAWNQLVDGLRAVNDHVRTAVASTLAVTITNVDLDASNLIVTAANADGPQVFQAVRDPDSVTIGFTFSELPAGVYTVRATAPGFATVAVSATVPDDAAVEITLAPDGALMPNVFGVPLRQALKTMTEQAINVARVLYITGRYVAPANPSPDFADAPILAQIPDAGVAVPKDAAISLVVAASLREEPSVEMPSLAGLTLDEARQALESIGLVLGDVTTKKS